MVANLIDSLTCSMQHFVLVTGLKHYMGPFEKFDQMKDTQVIPFKETNPRLPFKNFYYAQEDVLFERAAKKGFTWSIARPNSMIGYCLGQQMNIGIAIAVYACLCKHQGMPFVFPGTPSGYDVFLDATDVDLLADHVIWQATNPNCANQAYNVVNGDVFRYQTFTM